MPVDTPLVRRTRGPPADTPFLMEGTDGQRILVVDGQESWAAIEGILQARGYTALTPADGGQALQVIKEARPDLVVAVRSPSDATGADSAQLNERIITIMSHELRSPLTYVTGYTELALENVSSDPRVELRELLLGIKKGADRLTRLVEDLLFLVRLDSGWVATEIRLQARVHRDLQTIVQRAVQLYDEQAAAQGVVLEIRVGPDLPPVQLSESFFVDALGRLVHNAIKFSRGEEKLVTVSAQPVDGWVEVAVTDKGVGVAPGETPHLFERFRQIGRERMEQQGVGLGLAIAQDLIRLQGGEITFESTSGEGSTFTIRLPAIEEV